MSERYRVKIGALIIALALAGALFTLPFSAQAVQSLQVSRLGASPAAQYSLSVEEAEGLVSALQGDVVNALPGSTLAAYGMRISLSNMLPRAYEVYVTADREVYLKRPNVNRIVRSSRPEFFFVHDAFADIYPHSAMPDITISVADANITPTIGLSQWDYQKWDDKWYSGAQVPVSQGTAETVVVTADDTKLSLGLSLPADAVLLTVIGPDGKVRFSEPVVDGTLPLIAFNGTYQYEISAIWGDAGQDYRGEYRASFPVKVELPPVFLVPGPMVVQGQLAQFYALHMPEGVTPVLETDMAANVSLFPYEDGFVAYIPTHYGTRPGEYTFTYGLPGQEVEQSQVRVVTREFHIQYMTIDPGTQAATQNAEAYAQYNRYFPPSRQVSSPERYYSEPFVLPVGYSRLTTEFGQTRYVNNSPTASRHSGLDMAAPSGTPVVATNSGKVTLAMYLILTGNTLVIDHGQGLFSVHFHMHELHVSEGEIVERGQQVGTVGSTGFSTGPHLHFTMSYFTHNIEPGYFLVGEPITFANSVRYLGR